MLSVKNHPLTSSDESLGLKSSMESFSGGSV